MTWRTDVAGQCTDVGPGWCSLVGRRRDQELGRGWAAHVHAEDLPSHLERFGRAHERRTAFVSSIRVREAATGAFITLVVAGTPVHQNGQFTGMAGFVRRGISGDATAGPAPCAEFTPRATVHAVDGTATSTVDTIVSAHGT